MSPERDDRTGRHDPAGSDDALALMARRVLREATVDADFRQRLRDHLITEARERPIPISAGAGGARRRRPGFKVVLPAVAAVVAAAVLAFTLVRGQQRRTPAVLVSATSDVQGSPSVDPTSSVRVRFSQPMDHRSVESALRVVPALLVQTSWQGNDLIVTTAHGMAPDTGYTIGFDPSRARTANGARLAADPYVTFGTAPTPPPQRAVTVADLTLSTVASSADGSEAVIANDGSLLATALKPGRAAASLTRVVGSQTQRIAAATDAICVSRSGQSVAYLEGSGTATSIVMADGNGLHGRMVPVQVDSGSPLGWIGDSEVSFVSGGSLKAVNRSGQIRTLTAGTIHADSDTVTIAPGGRWVYLAVGSQQANGRVMDVQTGATHPLPPGASNASFSSDGATVYWVDTSSPTPRLAVAPSGGGPVLSIPLPVQAGDQITDLGVDATGSRLLYTVHSPNGSAQLRLADLPTGTTLAQVGLNGQSPNWAPNAARAALLVTGGSGPRIDLLELPPALRVTRSSVEQTAVAFANAQAAGDLEAVRSLATAGVDPAGLPRPSRASVLSATPGAGNTWQVELRLIVDPTLAAPVQQGSIETLTIDSSTGRPLVTAASAPPLRPLAPGPHPTVILTASGTVTVTFDSDLDPATVARGITVSDTTGHILPVSTRYDPGSKAIVASGQLPSTVRVGVTGQLKDISGQSAQAFTSLVSAEATP